MIPFSLLLSELIMKITQNEHHQIFIRENFLWPRHIWKGIKCTMRNSHLCGWTAAFWKESPSSKLDLMTQGPSSTEGQLPLAGGRDAQHINKMTCVYPIIWLIFPNHYQQLSGYFGTTVPVFGIGSKGSNGHSSKRLLFRIVVNSRVVWFAAKGTSRPVSRASSMHSSVCLHIVYVRTASAHVVLKRSAVIFLFHFLNLKCVLGL